MGRFQDIARTAGVDELHTKSLQVYITDERDPLTSQCETHQIQTQQYGDWIYLETAPCRTNSPRYKANKCLRAIMLPGEVS